MEARLMDTDQHGRLLLGVMSGLEHVRGHVADRRVQAGGGTAIGDLRREN